MVRGRTPDVIVVGAGYSGLTAAVVLQRDGWRVHVVTADDPADTVSMLAAAVWFPTAVGPADRVVAWGRRSREVFERLAAEEPDAGVVLRETLHLYRQHPRQPWWVPAVGRVEPATRKELPSGYTHGLRYVVPLAETPIYLPWLLDRFHAEGGTVERRRLGTLEELDGAAPVVVDCAGLGARELVGDDELRPIRGHVVRTTNPGLTRSVRDQDHPGGYTYIHPRSEDCVLGGTLEPGEWDTSADETTGKAILERCRGIVPELADAAVLGQAVGLRPGRPTVRLEIDPAPPDGLEVVHDYGHGGAGMTLSWGCAEEAAELVAAALATRRVSWRRRRPR